MLVLAGSAAAAFVYLRYVRPWQLTWGATAAEVSRDLPSDDLVSRPTFDATRAITLEPPPEQVWPWLVQMGLTRAGWYSYDLLDNLGRPSARCIVPELQRLEPGDIVPMSPNGKQGMKVLSVEPPTSMVWGEPKALPGRGSSTKPTPAEPDSSPVSGLATSGSLRPSRSPCCSSSATSG